MDQGALTSELARKQKMIKKYEILDQLLGKSREGSYIKQSFLKGLLSKSIDENIVNEQNKSKHNRRDINEMRKISAVTSIQKKKDLRRPHRDFAVSTKMNPVHFRKFPE